MAKTSLSLTNVNKPAPKWYRKTKRIVGLLSAPTVIAVFEVFDLTDKQMAKIGVLISFLPTLLEIFSALLANGEHYQIVPEDEEKLKP